MRIRLAVGRVIVYKSRGVDKTGAGGGPPLSPPAWLAESVQDTFQKGIASLSQVPQPIQR